MAKLTIVAVLLLVASCLGQEYLPGIPLNPVSGASTFLARSGGIVRDDNDDASPTPNFCAGKFGPVCLNCHSLLTCADEVINTQTCTSMDPSKPFCQNSACTSENAVADCNIPFRCTAQGPFPNPGDCTMYYFCTDTTLQGSIVYKCPTNYVYDSKSGLCKQKKVSSDCKTISCNGFSNQYQVFAADKSILIYCADTVTVKETILFRCKDYDNMEYDADTLQCKYVCKTEGRFVDREDCTKYYNCYKSGTTYAAQHLSCPAGFSYSSDRQNCVPQPTGTACTPELG